MLQLAKKTTAAFQMHVATCGWRDLCHIGLHQQLEVVSTTAVPTSLMRDDSLY